VTFILILISLYSLSGAAS